MSLYVTTAFFGCVLNNLFKTVPNVFVGTQDFSNGL